MHNLAGAAEAVELDLREFRGATPVEMLGGSRFPTIDERPYVLTLAPPWALLAAAAPTRAGRRDLWD